MKFANVDSSKLFPMFIEQFVCSRLAWKLCKATKRKMQCMLMGGHRLWVLSQSIRFNGRKKTINKFN